MIELQDDITVFVNLDSTDMRKSINGLCALVLDEFEQSPQSRSVFVFCNRARNKVKCLYWDHNGFVLHYKRLEQGRFQFKKALGDGRMEITQAQLKWLLSGLDFSLMHAFSTGNNDKEYAHFY